jgi:chromatin remodeling complex protein RSC6
MIYNYHPRTNEWLFKPMVVSEELLLFLNLHTDSRVNRRDITIGLHTYITVNKLRNPTRRSRIIPDKALIDLLNITTHDPELSYFNLDDFVDRIVHFIPS